MSAVDKPPTAPADVLRMTADVAAAYLGHNVLPTAQLTDLIKTIYSALQSLDRADGAAAGDQKPVVPIKKSITPDFIICLEDGKKLKMLKRHLRTAYGLSPEEYRAKWGLPPDYPMVAPNYAEQRSVFARKIGLGHKTSAKKKK